VVQRGPPQLLNLGAAMQTTARRVFLRPLVLIALVTLGLAPSLHAGQDSKSAASAKELTQVLDAAKLDAIAVADPSTPGSFIAAIYIPETQLLVVSAKYSAPALLVDKIKSGDFRGVYMDLHAAATTGTKIFVQDMGPDGLVSRNDNGDSWEEGGKTLVFDGQWKKAKSSEAEYTKAFTDADEHYARMLSLLLTEVKQVKASR
jgi:hypothetical protein